jgi:hypothetical protein
MTRPSRWAWIISTWPRWGRGWCSRSCFRSPPTTRRSTKRHYVWLFRVNVALASALVAVIVVAGVRMLWRVSRGRFGSRLLLKLAAIFALVGILPGVLIYAVSYQFVSRSIESWFDVKVEGALDAGLNLGRGTIDAIVADVATKTRLAAERLGENALMAEPLSLERLREQLSAKEVSIVGSSGQTLLATASARRRAAAGAHRGADAAPGAGRSASSPGRGPRRGRRRRRQCRPRPRRGGDPEQQLHARRAGALPSRRAVDRPGPGPATRWR